MQQTQDTVRIDSTQKQEEIEVLSTDTIVQTENNDSSSSSKDTVIDFEQKETVVNQPPRKQKDIVFSQSSTKEVDSLVILKDSLFKDSINNAIVGFRTKLELGYLQHNKQQQFLKGNPKDNSSNDWSLFIILLCLLVLALSKAKYNKRFNLLLKSIQSWKFAKQIIRYEKVYSHPTNISLLLIFVLSSALFVQKALLTKTFDTEVEIQLFLLICICLMAIYIIKFLVLIIIGKIFNIQEITDEYIFHALLFFKFTGIILLPISIIYIFAQIGTSISLWLGIFVIVLSYIIRLARRVLIGLQANENLYSIILYLCTLEILPVLVIGKFFKDLLIS